jgi:hypothetical protein
MHPEACLVCSCLGGPKPAGLLRQLQATTQALGDTLLPGRHLRATYTQCSSWHLSTCTWKHMRMRTLPAAA